MTLMAAQKLPWIMVTWKLAVSGAKGSVLRIHRAGLELLLSGNIFSELSAPNGKIVTGDVRDTVKLDADTVITLNLIDNVKVTGKNILVYGTKVTYDVEFFLKEGGKIRFYDQGSGFDISDDATINLENGKMIKIRDLKHDKLISLGGKDITYDYIDDRGNIKKSNKNNSGSRLVLGKCFTSNLILMTCTFQIKLCKQRFPYQI